MEISALGVTKAATLAADLRPSSASRRADVVAFGDMPNDLAMLDLGRHVVRHGNAHPSVLERPTTSRPANDEDGVAATSPRLFGL